jgi:hypothetical protein
MHSVADRLLTLGQLGAKANRYDGPAYVINDTRSAASIVHKERPAIVANATIRGVGSSEDK